MPQLPDKSRQREKLNLQEIAELAQIPEVENFLVRAVEDAKEQFKDEIERYRKIVLPTFSDGVSKDKSFFFEMTRVDDPTNEAGFRWELGKFRLQPHIAAILEQFAQEVENSPVIPQQQQEKILKSLTTEKNFKVTFMKNDDSRVVGFIEEMAEEEKEKTLIPMNQLKEEGFLIKETQGTIKLNISKIPSPVFKEEIYRKILDLMEKDDKARNDIIFYYSMVQRSKGEPF